MLLAFLQLNRTLLSASTLGGAVKSNEESTELNESTGADRQDAEVNSIYADSAQYRSLLASGS